MYTSFGKANDRFGFSTGGTFSCAFRNDRLAVIAGVLVIALIVITAVSDIVWLVQNTANAGAQASAGMYDMIYNMNTDGAKEPKLTVWGGAINTGFAIVILAVIGIVLIFLHRGKLYKFTANDETFIVTYPAKERTTVEFRYDDIIGLTWEKRKFPLAPECLDITVKTKIGDFDYRVILTKIGRVNGITETPFNYIREKIGLAPKDEIDLISRGVR